MENKEIWKNIKDYPNYQVSNMGRVKSLSNNKTRKEKILKLHSDRNGYLFLSLSKDGKYKNIRIHRLVATAFIPNPNNLPEVNHRNEDKTDNRVENLEYCNRKYNINYGTRTEKTQKPVLQFSKENNFIKKWNSATDVERELCFNKSSICMCCKGKRKSVGGYVWGYADDYERIPFKVFDLEMYRKAS